MFDENVIKKFGKIKIEFANINFLEYGDFGYLYCAKVEVSLFHMDAKSRRPKYIIAGFNKTGTKSLGDAFKQLGFRVFDAKETYSIMCEHWCDFFRGKITIEDVAKIYEKEGAGMGLQQIAKFQPQWQQRVELNSLIGLFQKSPSLTVS